MNNNIFKVMTDPRRFIRALGKKNMGTMPAALAWVIGMVYLIRQAASFQLSLYYPYGYILLASVIFAIPFGYLIIYIFSFFLYWAGKLFKGRASYGDLYTASAYGKVPEVFVLTSWLLLTILLRQAAFTQIYILPELPQVIAVLLFVQIFFYIWEFVVSLHTIGEVQGFSAWMGLWNYILAGVLLVLVELLVQFIVASIFSFTIHGPASVSTITSLIT